VTLSLPCWHSSSLVAMRWCVNVFWGWQSGLGVVSEFDRDSESRVEEVGGCERKEVPMDLRRCVSVRMSKGSREILVEGVGSGEVGGSIVDRGSEICGGVGVLSEVVADGC